MGRCDHDISRCRSNSRREMPTQTANGNATAPVSSHGLHMAQEIDNQISITRCYHRETTPKYCECQR